MASAYAATRHELSDDARVPVNIQELPVAYDTDVMRMQLLSSSARAA